MFDKSGIQFQNKPNLIEFNYILSTMYYHTILYYKPTKLFIKDN